jgi:hypothetical protein
MRKFTFILGVATAISSSVFAGPILNIKFDVDGKRTSVGQEGELTPFNDFSYVIELVVDNIKLRFCSKFTNATKQGCFNANIFYRIANIFLRNIRSKWQ